MTLQDLANPHPFAPASEAVATLAPGGTSLIAGSRYAGRSLWWAVRPMLHERVLRPIWFGTPDGIAPLAPHRLSPMKVQANLWAARMTARRVQVRGLDAYRDGDRRILYTGQTRQWPAADGTPIDRFFGPLLDRLKRAGFQTVSTFPASENLPWYRPGPGRTVAQARNQAGAPHVPFERYVDQAAWRTFRTEQRRFGQRAAEIASSWEEVAGDLPFPDPKSRALARDGVLYLHRTALPATAFLIATARKAIDDLDPHIVLMLNEYGTFEKALQIAAQERGIPVVAVQHGAIYPAHPGYVYPARYLSEQVPPDQRVSLPDSFTVYGDHHRRFLVEAVGWPRERIIVTGHSNADRVHRLVQETQSPLGPERRPRLLWLTQAHAQSEQEKARNEATVLEALKTMDKLEVVIKPHPGESDTYERMRRKDPRISVLPPRTDLYTAILETDVAMAKDSTAALEAMAFGRPVIILNTTHAPDRIDYVEKGAALAARDATSLVAALRESLQDDPTAQDRTAYVIDQFGPLDGKATERLANHIQAVVG